MHHLKVLEDYLLLLMLLLQVLLLRKKQVKKTIKSIFYPRGEIKNYNVLIDGRNFYDQPINDLIKQYDEIWKVSTGYGDDYASD